MKNKIFEIKKFVITFVILATVSISGAAQTGKQAAIHEAFRAEVGKYFKSISLFYFLYKPELAQDTGELDYTALRQAQDDFHEIDRLCRTKYRGIANPTDPQRSQNIAERFGDWCELAARQDEFMPPALEIARKNIWSDFTGVWKMDIAKAMGENALVENKVQTMVFDTAAWKAKEMARMQKRAAEVGGTVPPSVFRSIEEDIKQLKAKIFADGKVSKWENSGHKNAAIEGFVRSKFLATHPGIVIVKSEMGASDWTLLKNGLGIPTVQTHRGWVLVKMPNQEGLCQGRPFGVKKVYMGGGKFSAMTMDGYGLGGLYAACN